MIFPEHCKEVGYITGKPCGDRVYFLSRYMIRERNGEYEILEVEQSPGERGMMRGVASLRTIAGGKDVVMYPSPVNLHDRTNLLNLALESGHRCTIFRGLDEHTTFVCDPDLSIVLTLHVYDLVPPPRPHLSATIRELERDGLFGEISVGFAHHVRDIRKTDADVYPCRAAGFQHTLDSDRVLKGERVAGCMTGAQILEECGGPEVRLEEICPLESVREEPFIARCCRSEREGVRAFKGRFGGVVHWGATPWTIAETVRKVAEGWRTHAENRGR
ncbi:MAG TPA: hypothetical protein VKO45_09470 [Methanomicrobiales archaeon]|nr:hypothetical protein [Methanomicrobiales archaeon]